MNDIRWTRRQLLGTAAALTAGSAISTTAFAQASWPSKPIRFVVPFAAGGSSDIVARSTAAELTRLLQAGEGEEANS